MSDDEIRFFKQEKLKFENLLNKFGWTKDCLLKDQESFLQCPIDPGHRFPVRSKHVQTCQLIKEGFSKDYLKELAECEQEKQLLHQSGIVLTPSSLSNILHRPVAITTDIPLSVEQSTVLFTPNERSEIAQTIHNEALRLKVVPPAPLSINDNHSTQSQISNVSQQLNKLDELRDQKRRRIKYVTRTTKKSFYDAARETINTEMELIEQVNRQAQDEDRVEHSKQRHSKHKHRSSSKKKSSRKHKKKDRSSRRDSSKHHRHSQKRRTS